MSTIARPSDSPRPRRLTRRADLSEVLDLGVEHVEAAAFVLRPGPIAPFTTHPLVIVDGAVMRGATIPPRVGAELLGPGDVLADTSADGEVWRPLLRALTPVTVAVVPPPDGVRVRPPGLDLALLVAVERQAARALAQRTTFQTPQLDERIAALLPMLADRWGVVTSEGIVLPAFLRHSVLAPLCGVRRPSFTTAAQRLEDAGTLVRLPDGRWLVDRRLAIGAPAV